MLNAQFRPLDHWPGERTRNSQSAAFKVTYERSLDLLESELAKLRAKNITVQIDGLTSDFTRNDGWPKSSFFNLKAQRCGVIVAFESSKGAISMPCDKFNNWKDNLRAIALSLEALRMVDRYGVTRGNEQYRGWARLEASTNGKMTREQAAAFIAKLLNIEAYVLDPEVSGPSFVEAMCKKAMVASHPDRGGSHEIFVKIGQAQAVLLEGKK